MTTVPSSFLKRHKGPPEPPLKPGGSGSAVVLPTTQIPVATRSDTDSVALQTAIQSAVANELQSLNDNVAAVLQQHPQNSPFGIMGAAISNQIVQRSAGGIALLLPVIEDWRTQATNAVQGGNPDTNPQPITFRSSLVDQLQGFMTDLTEIEMTHLLTGLQFGLQQAIAQHTTQQTNNDILHCQMFNGYANVLGQLGVVAERFAVQGPLTWEQLAAKAKPTYMPEVVGALTVAIQSHNTQYADLSVDLQACHAIALGDMTKQRNHTLMIQSSSGVINVVLNSLRGNIKMTPEQTQALLVSGAENILMTEISRLTQRFNLRSSFLSL